MEENLGRRGATRESWGRDASRVAFKEVYDANPTAGERELAEKMREKGFEDESIDRAVYLYTVHNMLEALKGYERRAAPARPRIERTPEQAAARQQESIERRASIRAQAVVVLLNLPMANGKLARNCTGEELIEMGGNWVKLGKKIGKNKILGQVLNEKEAQAIYFA
jgi:hypothetical protein